MAPGWPPNPPNGGLFHATAAPSRDCAGAGCLRGAARRNQKKTCALSIRRRHPRTAHSAPPPPPREAHHYQQQWNMEPAAATVARPPEGAGIFFATTETRPGARCVKQGASGAAGRLAALNASLCLGFRRNSEEFRCATNMPSPNDRPFFRRHAVRFFAFIHMKLRHTRKFY